MSSNQRIIDAITRPQDLHCLTNEELAIVCQELRDEMVRVTSENGGHLASSLGTVEIIVALHSLLDCPEDKIVFDVGHQAYAHKMLTGRLDQFDTLRKFGGISSFPNPDESEYDVHYSGHASDSLSVAMGLAKARDLRSSNEKVVAIIGDAALSGGMAFEALNHIGQEEIPMLIVLNDNNMSISHPVGALVRHLGRLRASGKYHDAREAMQEKLEDGGIVAGSLLNFGRNVKDSMKQFVVPHSMLFEQLSITCTSPIDGHNIAALREAFSYALKSPQPILAHVVTHKGQGYEPAERNPELFHGIGPFNRATGEPRKKSGGVPSYTKVFGDALVAEASENEDIVALTAAMPTGTGLDVFGKRFPERFIDTGITEEHAAGLAAGLAAGGKRPVLALYSTFLQRAFDQVIVDNALGQANVVFAIDRAGLVGDDGPTHHGAFDMAYLRMIPHMRIMAPSDEAELVHCLHTALHMTGPVALRYPRGEAQGASLPETPCVLEEGKSRCLREGNDVAILAFGRMAYEAMAAAEILDKSGIKARVVDMRWVKPIDEEAVRAAAQTQLLVSVEDGVRMGGAGSAVLECLAALELCVPVLQLGLPDDFVEQGKVNELFEKLGIDGKGIARAIMQRLRS